jgi:hypothetical protein
MKVNFYWSALLISCFCSCHSQSNISFTPVPELRHVDTSEFREKKIFNRFDYYLVNDFDENRDLNKIIDSFCRSVLPQDVSKYNQYDISFYKHSATANLENIKKRGGDFDRASPLKDLLYIYTWSNGKLIGKYKFKDGRMIEPSNNIKISPIPDSSSH